MIILSENLNEDERNTLLKKTGFKLSEARLKNGMIYEAKLNININEDGIIEQFKGYFDLKELDWEGYRKKYGDIHRLDRILKAEGKSPDEYKLVKTG